MDKDKGKNKDFFAELKVSLELEGKKRLCGDNLFQLLENVLTYGSISRAAAQIGKSYRYSWGLIQEAEKTLKFDLVKKQVGGYAGGGAFLTPEGKKLLMQYKAFKHEIDKQLKNFLEEADHLKHFYASKHPTSRMLPKRPLLLASTMEPVETGLLDLLENAFYVDSGILIRHVATGSGDALRIAREGHVDMVLSHAPELEEEFMREGWGKSKVPIMTNNFVVVGPVSDPAEIKKIRGTSFSSKADVGYASGISAVEAFRQIASSSSFFISRGDRSGTHLREQEIWKLAKIIPQKEQYIVSSGIIGNMGTLRLAIEKQAYTLVDKASYMLSDSQGKLTVFAGGGDENNVITDTELVNTFVVIIVNPKRVPMVEPQRASIFIKWLQEEKGKEIISDFGLKSFGRPLFSAISENK